MLLEVCLLTISLLTELAQGSKGDRHVVFQTCLSKCSPLNGCPRMASDFKWAIDPCFSCKYDCMWKTVKEFELRHEKIPQFFGKWPFVALRFPFTNFPPVQELASVIFSLLNLYSSLRMYRAVRRLSPKSRMRNVWIVYSMIGVFVWIASCIFHWTDFWLTEWLDYSCAFAVVVYTFFAAISFTVPYLQRTLTGNILWSALFVALLSFYYKHVSDLWTRIDYGYNMRCCIVLSLATTYIYGIWMAFEWNRSKPKDSEGPAEGGKRKHKRDNSWEHKKKSITSLAIVVFGGMTAMLLEVLDFAPVLWLVDAHSLFHLATAPLPLYLIDFIKIETDQEIKAYQAAAKLK